MSKTKEMWDYLRVRLSYTEPVLGGIPKDPKIVKAWIDAQNKEKVEEERAKIAEATIEDLEEAASEKEAKGWTTFRKDEKGIYFPAYYFIAMLKEAANINKDILGIKNFKSKFVERVYVMNRRVYPDPLKPKEDGIYERPVRAMTMQGPRVSLKKSDYIEDFSVNLMFRCLHDPGKNGFETDILVKLLEYCRYAGFGENRPQGFGTFEIDHIHQLDRKGNIVNEFEIENDQDMLKHIEPAA